MVPPEHVVALSGALFAIGVLGVLIRRNLIAVLMSIELMLAAVNLSFLAFNRMHVLAGGDAPGVDGQIFALLVMTVAAAEVAVGLGMIVALVRNRDSLNLDDLSLLRW